jgi:hypothetical protein
MSRTRRTIAIAAFAAVVVTGSLAGASARTAPAKTASVADMVPDAYGLEQLDGTVKGSQVSFFQRRPCSQVLDTLRAGQWTINLFGKPTAGAQQYTATMTYGDRAAMLMMSGAGSSCSGSVQVETEQPATMSGAARAAGTARALPVYCHVGPDPSGTSMTDLIATYIGLYRGASGSFLLMVSGPAAKGTHKLVADEDSEGVMVLPVKPGSEPLAAAAGFMTGWYSGAGFGESIKGMVGMFAGSGTLTVTTSSPFAATLTGPKLTDQMGHAGSVSLTAGLGCDS